MRDVSSEIRFWSALHETPEAVAALNVGVAPLVEGQWVCAYHQRYVVAQILDQGRALFGQMVVLSLAPAPRPFAESDTFAAQGAAAVLV